MLAEKLQNLIQRFKTHRWLGTPVENLILGVLVCGLLWTIFAGFGDSAETLETKVSNQPEVFDVDEYLPEGFVLLPLEFENQTALDPLIGAFAILNIYQSVGEESKRGRLVAKNVKVLRAPQYPQALAALIPENQVTDMMKNGNGFYGVIQRRKMDLNFEKAKKVTRPTMTIQSFDSEPAGAPL